MITIQEWNEQIKNMSFYNKSKIPCDKCPFKTSHSCIIYWDEPEEKIFGKMEENECYKLGCLYFKQANE